MEYIRVTKDNLEQEHICCAISNKQDIQVTSKKEWLRGRMDEGLVFLKSTERGKCFIEYLPAENAWAPVQAEGYMYINCLWVSGSLKGHGYSNDLLDACVEDSRTKGRAGLCILSADKKRPFLADPSYLKHKGFLTADRLDTGFALMYLPFDHKAPVPRFKDQARHPVIPDMGYVLYYTHQCPFNAKYVPVLEKVAAENQVPFQAVLIQSREQAQAFVCPCTTYALFYNGQFVTREVLSDKKFLKMIQEHQAKEQA